MNSVAARQKALEPLYESRDDVQMVIDLVKRLSWADANRYSARPNYFSYHPLHDCCSAILDLYRFAFKMDDPAFGWVPRAQRGPIAKHPVRTQR
jgi:hypothetical protein